MRHGDHLRANAHLTEQGGCLRSVCDDYSRPDLLEQHFKDGSASVRACQVLAAPSLNAPDVCLENLRIDEVGQALDPLFGGLNAFLVR